MLMPWRSSVAKFVFGETVLDERRPRLVHHVDPARRHVFAGGVDLLTAAAGDRADADEAAAFDRDVGANRGIAGAVEHLAAADDDVVDRHGRLCGQRQREQDDRGAGQGDAANGSGRGHGG